VAPALRGLAPEHQRDCLLAGGDDYELLFTAEAAAHDAVLAAGRMAGVAVTRIGRLSLEQGLHVRDAQGQAIHATVRGFDHFAD
jgi:thiamine-monophosphate kinase